MRKRIAVWSCVLLAASSAALAQDQAKKEPSDKERAEQEKLKVCNKQASERKLTGDARERFVSSCLKGA
jgi:hypothetical protein